MLAATIPTSRLYYGITTDIRYIEGQDNNVTDALSRIEAIGMSVYHQTLAAAQENDTELRDLDNSGTYALLLKKTRFPDQNVDIHCDVSGDTVRPYVPKAPRTFPSRDTRYTKPDDDAFCLTV